MIKTMELADRNLKKTCYYKYIQRSKENRHISIKEIETLKKVDHLQLTNKISKIKNTQLALTIKEKINRNYLNIFQI